MLSGYLWKFILLVCWNICLRRRPVKFCQVYFNIFTAFFTCRVSMPCFVSADRVQPCCTELFDAFSLDYFYGSITHMTGTRPYHRSKHLFVKGHGSGNLSTLFLLQSSWLRWCCSHSAGDYFHWSITHTTGSSPTPLFKAIVLYSRSWVRKLVNIVSSWVFLDRTMLQPLEIRQIGN